MSEAEEAVLQAESSENTPGVVLGYWDHEKTPTLIQDLEQSVNLVELKCKKLLEELKYYKKYLEKLEEVDFHLTAFKKKSKKLRNSVFFSGSEPDIAFRKNCIHFQKIKQAFEEKFQDKLKNINKELKEAAEKIGLKDSIILLPINTCLKSLSEKSHDASEIEGNDEEENEENKENEDENDEINRKREKFIELAVLNPKTKSDSVLNENAEDLDFSKITKNQLALYQKLSRLSMKKRRNRKAKVKRKKAKFFLRRKTLSYRRGFLTGRCESRRPKPGVKKWKKRKNEQVVLKKSKSRLPRKSSSTVQSKDSKIHQSPPPATSENLKKTSNEVLRSKKTIEKNFALKHPLKKVIPFTVCSSTSKSYNIGLNMQQLLSLPKYGRKANVRISASEKMHGVGRKTNTEGLMSKSSLAEVKKRLSTPWNNSQTKSEGQKGDTWVSEILTSSNCRKFRSKITKQSTNGVFKYLKSTTSQFTNGQKSMIQSESKAAYAVGSKIMVSDCQRTDIFEIGKRNDCIKNASGDGKGDDKCADLNTEWAKVYNSFLKIYKKYTNLKEKFSVSDSVLNEELKSLEKDIDHSVEKYREFLQYYSKFLHLNHRLKSLKISCETKTLEPVTTFSSNCQRKIWYYKPTHSMAMKDAFREVQALQAKINLVHNS